MNKLKIAVLTTVFPMEEQLLSDFFTSLEEQSIKDFKIIAVNDGYPNFETVKQKFPALDIIELPYKNTPAKNREHGINYVKSAGFDVLIFGDSDDYFEKNRIEIATKLLTTYDIVVNDLSLFDKNGIYKTKYLSNRIQNRSEIHLDFIKDKNIFGLSNTAINTSIIDKVDFDNDLVAIDWYFFSTLLLKGYKAVFTNETETFYRQYQNNTIGLSNPVNDQFEKRINIKKKHYDLMQKFDISYTKLYNETKMDAINYDSKNRKKIENPLWWE